MNVLYQSPARIFAAPLFLTLLVCTSAVSEQTAPGKSISDGTRPPEVVVLKTIEENAGFGSELHRVTIRGTTRDSTGKPIGSARVYVASHNSISVSGFQKLRGQTTTNEAGEYELTDVQLLVNRNRPNPLPQPAEGGFVVFGEAKGYGITWAHEHQYRPEERPDPTNVDNKRPDKSDHVYFNNEPVVVDLEFDLPATMHGRVTDDQGRPIPNATVSLGLIPNWRDPTGHGSWSCVYVGKDVDARPIPFDAIVSLPSDLREARTDADGRYQFDQLRRDSTYLGMISPDPTFDAYQFNLSTQSENQSKSRTIHTGYAGTLDHTFERPREVNIHVVDQASEQPVPDAIVTAYHRRKVRHIGSRARTDANGRVQLRLPPSVDDYELWIEPCMTERLLLQTLQISVPKDKDAIDVPVKLEPAAIVQFRCTDADSGEPVSGVYFEYETDTISSPTMVSSQSVYVDHPVTDKLGLLTAYLPPGRRRFIAVNAPFPAQRRGSAIPDHESHTRGEIVDLVAGETSIVDFKINSFQEDNTPLPARKSVFPEEYVEKWDAQAQLVRNARVKVSVRLSRTSGKGIDAATFLETFRNCAPYQVPDVESIFADTLDAKLHLTPMVITVDGTNNREDIYALDSHPEPSRVDVDGNTRPTRTAVSNGFESVHVHGFSNQVDVMNAAESRFHISNLHDLCRWPAIHRRRPGATQTDETLTPAVPIDLGERIAFELETPTQFGKIAVRQVCDKATGFIFETSYGPTLDDLSDCKFYFAPKKHPGGMILPGMQVSWKVRDGKVQWYELHLIDHVEVLDRAMPETFAVAIPAGSMIVDHRGIASDPLRPRSRPSQLIVTSAVTDTLAYLQRKSAPVKLVESTIRYGQEAPSIEPSAWLRNDGATEAPDLSGKVVLVDFWGVYCGPCVAQLPEVQKAADYFADEQFLLIGVHDSDITPDELAAYAEKNNLRFQLAIDKPATERGWFGETMRAYGVRGIPSSAVIDKEGNVVFVGGLKDAMFKVKELLP
ncbi:redoxin domain-containing protein [Rhodopirellula sp. SWK7]|uniref:redoxin domain-containing protein n=1 Tax=Rhodopirellula sp. SWK7 TaxID=595460 RepID=UPI001360B122|nr:redoxin domain-containing protein [Rhodopirellula sp. SWK7]